ncbi:hypothetical protein A9Q78_08800 [Methylophaga sp. 41_12_T18]|nr:hypothetical protein A9Q78_08800 [Methylophaga sp. 41_12_T18]
MLRVIIFCDVCNPQGIRYIEQTRSTQRGDEGGRRVTDGRSWFEGPLEDALKLDWLHEDGAHICPRCRNRQSST